MEANIVIVRLFTIDTGIKSEEIKVGRLPWQGYPIKNERNARSPTEWFYERESISEEFYGLPSKY